MANRCISGRGIRTLAPARPGDAAISRSAACWFATLRGQETDGDRIRTRRHQTGGRVSANLARSARLACRPKNRQPHHAPDLVGSTVDTAVPAARSGPLAGPSADQSGSPPIPVWARDSTVLVRSPLRATPSNIDATSRIARQAARPTLPLRGLGRRRPRTARSGRAAHRRPPANCGPAHCAGRPARVTLAFVHQVGDGVQSDAPADNAARCGAGVIRSRGPPASGRSPVAPTPAHLHDLAERRAHRNVRSVHAGIRLGELFAIPSPVKTAVGIADCNLARSLPSPTITNLRRRRPPDP